MEKLITKNPYSGETTGEFPYDSFEKAAQTVSRLRESQIKWAKLPLPERISMVRQGLKYFDANREEIARDISEQMGRPLHQSRGELNGFFERANTMCEMAPEVLKPDLISPKEGFERAIEHVPLGVVFVISAWNFPLLITVNSVVPGLIAGNTILLKHSSLTPKIARHFSSAFGTLGGHGPLLNDLIIDHAVTGRIIEELAIDHVVFTGSVSGGRTILSHASKKFMTPALELGGKDAAYVHHDADLKEAVATIVDGAMFNSGQSCCGIERAYIHSDVFDEFVKEAQKLIEEYRLGDPKDEKTTLGPLAQGKSAREMEKQIEEAVTKGAKVLTGGKSRKIGSGTFFEPTLIASVSQNMEIMQEENFGPILPVMKVGGIDEALKLVNDSKYGLTAAVFTRDEKTAKVFAEEANVGTVFMNRCDTLDPSLPWTGVKDSGCGSTLSKYGFYSLTRRKALHFKKGPQNA